MRWLRSDARRICKTCNCCCNRITRTSSTPRGWLGPRVTRGPGQAGGDIPRWRWGLHPDATPPHLPLHLTRMMAGKPRVRGGTPWSAWAVHFYTATGAVMAFLATREVFAGDLRMAFVWLFTALVVDSSDGTLARLAHVHERLPHFSGEKVDDLVDYLTFVFVPALIVWRADLVPAGWGLAVVAAMLLSSAYGFASADAETADCFFTGFPSFWNVVV